MRLCEFLKYLTELQHKHDPASEVVWYDSVIDTGIYFRKKAVLRGFVSLWNISQSYNINTTLIQRWSGMIVLLILEYTIFQEEGSAMRLCEFVKYLTELQHKHDPASEVVWYESVIDTGIYFRKKAVL